MGCYSMLAFNVNAFGVELPDNITEKPRSCLRRSQL